MLGLQSQSLRGYGVTGLAIFVDSFWMMLAGRCVTGLCGGSRQVVLLFTSEDEAKIRKALLFSLGIVRVQFRV